jgi:hypothetical protein
MTVSFAVIVSALGVLVAISTFLATVIFRSGQISGQLAIRVEALETWRVSIRHDMHEISDKLEETTAALRELSTLIEERTDRRGSKPIGCPLPEEGERRRK